MIDQLDDLELLILTIIGESRGEPIEGQVAVGSVILNRCNKYKDTIDKVVLRPNQFSCWNSNDPNRMLLNNLAKEMTEGLSIDSLYNQCYYVAEGLIGHQIGD